MDGSVQGMMVPFLVAMAVAIGGFAIAKVVFSALDAEKRRLKERLSGDTQTGDSDIAMARSIVRDNEIVGLSGLLVQMSVFDTLQKRLTQAFPDMTLSRLVAICSGLGLMGLLLGFLFTGTLLISFVAMAIGFYAPILIINSKRAKRQRMLADQLPESLDFLSRVLRAGHSLSTGLQMMGEELPKPLAGEFRRAYDQHSLGSPLDECLKDMSNRIESTDFAFFVTAVLIQRQTGGDLSEVLGNISDMIRQRVRLQQHVKAKTAEGRFTGYILAGFPLVMFFIAYSMNPDYAGVLLRTNIGLTLLGTAFGLQILGLWCIRKITTVTV